MRQEGLPGKPVCSISEGMQQDKLTVQMACDGEKWRKANEVFKKPFAWLWEVLVNMTGFDHPSGYAIIGPNHIVKSVWAGDTNEYPLGREVEGRESCIYIDNYEGPERSIHGWNSLSREDVEETFQCRFGEDDLAELGGFPNNLTIVY